MLVAVNIFVHILLLMLIMAGLMIVPCIFLCWFLPGPDPRFLQQEGVEYDSQGFALRNIKPVRLQEEVGSSDEMQEELASGHFRDTDDGNDVEAQRVAPPVSIDQRAKQPEEEEEFFNEVGDDELTASMSTSSVSSELGRDSQLDIDNEVNEPQLLRIKGDPLFINSLRNNQMEEEDNLDSISVA
eukprot:TRINITY_DN17041_c0_g1_i1.p1 TRINITY_DN17041_c0_g1~~TRINITY_DN17041_c0_g1_i1.p1  ORF type:complete len:185 (-),score=31.04 TRINITY_DN17041_c0_g1_i1:93-647(-)